MKKFQVITAALFLILHLNCSDNSAGPEEKKGELIVQNQIAAPGEIVQLSDYPLFVMNYSGDYGFGNYLKKANNSNKYCSGNDLKPLGCTCFSAMDSSCRIFGRNFDYDHHIALILFAHAPNAYSSISVTDISYLGFSASSTLEEIKNSSIKNRIPYCTLDGQNEKGVSAGLMSVPFVQPPYDPGKKNLACCDIIRLVLDYAASTDEAVSLISQYNFKDEKYPSHYLIADRNGKSAVIEFVNKELKVIRNNEPFQVATNFIITGSSAPQSTNCWRYNKVYSALKNANGNINEITAMNILQSASQSITMWSAVYNMNSFSLEICMDKNYDKVYSIKVGYK
jgi:predicted choloylglycine hydrolase